MFLAELKKKTWFYGRIIHEKVESSTKTDHANPYK